MLRDKFEEIEELDNRTKIGTYIAIPIVLLGLFYFLFLSSAFDEFSANQNKINSLQKELKKPTLRLVTAKIARLEKELVKNKTEIDENRQQLNFLQKELDSKSFLFISEKSISLFLNRVLEASLQKNVLIEAITIRDEDIPYIGNLKLKKVVDINASGQFLNELSFLRSVEKSTMLMKIENIHIVLQDSSNPLLSLEVKFYGAE